MRRSILVLTAILFATPAIAQTGATVGTQIGTSNYHEGMNLTLIGIDGEPVDNGSTMWGDDKNLSYPLSAGSHTLTLQVSAGGANETRQAVIFVAEGQQYVLGAETVLDQTTQDPSSYIAWVQDGAGNRVWNQQFNVISTVTYGKSPWQH